MMLPVPIFLLFSLCTIIQANTKSHPFTVKGNMNKRNGESTFKKLSVSGSTIEHEVTIAVRQQNLNFLHETLMDRSTPGNPLYQQWMTRDQVASFSSNSIASAAVKEWLFDNNINIISTTLNEEYITASAPLSKWQNLLNTTFHLWSDNLGKLYHRAESYSVPTSLSPLISTIFHTTQFPPKLFRTPHTKFEAASSTDKTWNATTQNSVAFRGTTVSFLNNLYKITTNSGASSLKQAVLELNSELYQNSDITAFQNKYGLPLQTAKNYGTQPLVSGCGFNNCGEGSLDIQYLMGIAQNSQSFFWYEDGSGGDPFFNFLMQVANASDPPTSLSMSWTAYEIDVDPSFQDHFNAEAMKLSLMGVTLFVSSGDDGVSGYSVMCSDDSSAPSSWTTLYNSTWSGQGYFAMYPATSPYVVAVGATMGPESGKSEVACQSNSGGPITTGGGFSNYNPRPSYQSAAASAYLKSTQGASASPGYNPNGRGYPDLSFMGVYYVPYIGGSQYIVSGTSASSPVAAALITLVNSQRLALGLPTVGFINPTLYANANKFTDITSGSNNCGALPSATLSPTCCAAGFTCAPGWDPVTGLGSITYQALYDMFLPSTGPNLLGRGTTASPSKNPVASSSPSLHPTETPSLAPSIEPSFEPSVAPSETPSRAPSHAPSKKPIHKPSKHPTHKPTSKPSVHPTTSMTPINTPNHTAHIIGSAQQTSRHENLININGQISESFAGTSLSDSTVESLSNRMNENEPIVAQLKWIAACGAIVFLALVASMYQLRRDVNLKKKGGKNDTGTEPHEYAEPIASESGRSTSLSMRAPIARPTRLGSSKLSQAALSESHGSVIMQHTPRPGHALGLGMGSGTSSPRPGQGLGSDVETVAVPRADTSDSKKVM